MLVRPMRLEVPRFLRQATAAPQSLRAAHPPHPAHICAGNGLAPAHICTGTGLAPAHICTGTGLAPAHIAGIWEVHCTGTGRHLGRVKRVAVGKGRKPVHAGCPAERGARGPDRSRAIFLRDNLQHATRSTQHATLNMLHCIREPSDARPLPQLRESSTGATDRPIGLPRGPQRAVGRHDLPGTIVPLAKKGNYSETKHRPLPACLRRQAGSGL